MSKAEHTTWKSRRISDDLFFVKDMDGNTVATVWDTDPNLDGAANARLICKAPEMLEMLKSCLAFVDVLDLHGIVDNWSERPKLVELIKSIEG